MRIVIPTSKHDASRLPIFTEVLCGFGNLSQHSILLCPTKAAEAEAYAAAAALRAVCPTVAVQSFPDFDGGWPMAPNAHWASVAAYLESIGNHEPWLWLEVDSVPMKPTWADALQRSYNHCGQPFMGVVRETVLRAQDGTLFTQPDDLMMQGVAIYPSYLLRLPEIAPLFNNFTKHQSQAPDQPFDVYLRWIFRRAGWHNTEMIDDQWNTGNYRMDAFLPIGEPLEDGRGMKRSGIISAEAVLVHGCKDDSLHRLMLPQPEPVAEIRSEEIIPLTPPEPPKHTVAPAPAKKPKPGDLPVDRFLDGNSRFLMKRPTPEEEATWPCTKKQMMEFAKGPPRGRLRGFVAKFGWKNNDDARRALWHWGWDAPVPHTYLGVDNTIKPRKH
jgi:hypothetical protein